MPVWPATIPLLNVHTAVASKTFPALPSDEPVLTNTSACDATLTAAPSTEKTEPLFWKVRRK